MEVVLRRKGRREYLVDGCEEEEEEAAMNGRVKTGLVAGEAILVVVTFVFGRDMCAIGEALIEISNPHQE